MLKRILFFTIFTILAALGASAADGTAKATFAGGCFWCMEGPYDKIPGVESTVSGYAGGHVEDPTYEQVSSGGTGHAEVVQITYDPEMVDYATLLEVYWRNIDPFDGTGQFCDRGSSYRPAIFYHNEEQRRTARESRKAIAERFENDIEVEIEALDEFYPAEQYHQNYYEKNPLRYKFYRTTCGRDGRLKEIWDDEAGAEQILQRIAE